MAESMTGLKRTHRCAELSEANIGEKVTIMGWVQKNRNKGGLVFVDVRDRSGLIQVVFEEGSTDKALLEKAAKLRSEFVVAIWELLKNVPVQLMKILQQVRLRSNRKNSEFYLNLRHLRSQSKRIPRQKTKYV